MVHLAEIHAAAQKLANERKDESKLTPAQIGKMLYDAAVEADKIMYTLDECWEAYAEETR